MSYDKTGKASHYNKTRLESIVVFERTFGTLATFHFCEITAMKYRLRLGHKEDQPIEQEMLKIKWYEKKAIELRSKIGGENEIKVES